MPRKLALKRCKRLPKGFLTKKTRPANTQKQSVEGYLCSSCGKRFIRKDRLENHERLHTGEYPYICSSCNKGFRSKESLTNHAAVHTNERRFHCNECSLSFKTTHQLSKHRRFMRLAKSRKEPNHHRPVKCKRCNYLIMSKSDAKIHVSEHDKGIMAKIPAGPFMCSLCKESFQAPKQLGLHYRQRHEYSASSDEKHVDRSDCARCRRTFGSKFLNLNQKEPFPCRVPRIHQVHSYSQAERRRYTCHRCGRKFPKSSSLGKHLATHFEIDTYTCDTCKAEFADKQSSMSHNCPKRSAGSILVVKIMPQMGSTQSGLNEHTPNPTDSIQVTDTAICTQDDVSQQQLCLNIAHPPTERQENLQVSAEQQLEELSGEINLQLPMNKLVSESKPVMVVKFLDGGLKPL